MYLLKFVNRVREAQSYGEIEELPPPGADGSSPIELAMGCRMELDAMRLSSPQAAAAVADATGLPMSPDRVTVGLPAALSALSRDIHASRDAEALTYPAS